jgi:hypothetical protein
MYIFEFERTVHNLKMATLSTDSRLFNSTLQDKHVNTYEMQFASW